MYYLFNRHVGLYLAILKLGYENSVGLIKHTWLLTLSLFILIGLVIFCLNRMEGNKSW